MTARGLNTVGAPLSEGQRAELLSARRRGRSLRRGALLARISASISGFFSIACLLWSVGALAFGVLDWWSIVLFVGLGAVAWNEFRGASQLVACETIAPVRLALGQVLLGTLVIAYCSWALIGALLGPGLVSTAQAGDPQVAEMLAGYEELARMIAVGVYGTAIVLTLLFQGSGALYYLSKRRAVLVYMSETPTWILESERVRNGTERRIAA